MSIHTNNIMYYRNFQLNQLSLSLLILVYAAYDSQPEISNCILLRNDAQ